jgi:hypothetical protein
MQLISLTRPNLYCSLSSPLFSSLLLSFFIYRAVPPQLALRLKAQVFVSCSLPEHYEAVMLPLEIELARALATKTVE